LQKRRIINALDGTEYKTTLEIESSDGKNRNECDNGDNDFMGFYNDLEIHNGLSLC
jgi:hypothetical protein